VVAPQPLQLTPAQRTTIYRTIIPQSRGRKPIIRERIVTEPVAPVAPPVGRVVVPAEPTTVGEGYVTAPDDYTYVEEPSYVPAPREAYVPAPPAYQYTYAVGTRVPATARLAPLPRTVVATNPTLRPYRYMTFRGRVLLVDPATSTVVADVTP